MKYGHGLRGMRALLFGALLFLAGCASYSGYTLKPGVATLADVLQTMGEPAMRWDDPDGRVQLAYPRGPEGTQTFMAFVAPDGRLERIENVLRPEYFSRIVNGSSDQAHVLRLLGPSNPYGAAYFEARNELVWEWRFCDSWGQHALFNVLFDATSGIVRSTFWQPDYMSGRRGARFCGH